MSLACDPMHNALNVSDSAGLGAVAELQRPVVGSEAAAAPTAAPETIKMASFQR
jgi:hypothetical protein